MQWKRIEPTIVSKVGFRTVVSKTFKMPDGDIQAYQIFEKEGTECIATIALTPAKKVIVASEFRAGPEKVMDELPGGFFDHSNSREEAARRELAEETGYDAGDMEYLGYVYKDAYNNTKYHYFLATNCTPNKTGQQLEPTEHIEVKLISIDRLLENGRNGTMTDTEALFLAFEKLQKLKGE